MATYTLDQLEKESKKTYTAEQLEEMAGKKKSLLEKASKFFFEGTGNVAGGIITQGIGGAMQAYGGVTGNAAAQQKGQQLVDRGMAGMTLGNAAAAGLELYPGGSQVGKAVASKVGGFLEKSGLKSMAGALNATKGEMKRKSAEIAPEMLERGNVVLTADRTASKAAEAASKTGKELDEAYAALGPDVRLKVDPVIKSIEAAKAASTMADGVVVDATRAAAYDTVITTLKQYGDSISPETARKVRQIFDKGQDFTKAGELEAAVKEARKAAGNAIRGEISKASPDIAKLNAEMTFQLSLKEIAEETAERKVGQKGALNIVGGLATGAAALASGGGAEGMMIYSALGAGGVALITSPAWKSMSGIAKDRIGKMIAEGRFDAAATLMNRLVAAGISKTEE